VARTTEEQAHVKHQGNLF